MIEEHGIHFYNKDCMDALREFPGKFFELAIVDPVYGDVTKGGYMTHNKKRYIGTGKAMQRGYHSGLWQQMKTPPEYFDELFRVSKNQIIWGGAITLICQRPNAGSFGIKNTRNQLLSRIVSLHGLLLIKRQGFSALCGTGC